MQLRKLEVWRRKPPLSSLACTGCQFSIHFPFTSMIASLCGQDDAGAPRVFDRRAIGIKLDARLRDPCKQGIAGCGVAADDLDGLKPGRAVGALSGPPAVPDI